MTTDMRMHDAWEQSERARLVRDPEAAKDRAVTMFAFFDGWHAREDTARSGYATDANVLEDMIGSEHAHSERSHELLVKEYMRGLANQREISGLKNQIREGGLDPNDAPLYRRISNQRAEIKRLQKSVDANPATPRSDKGVDWRARNAGAQDRDR